MNKYYICGMIELINKSVTEVNFYKDLLSIRNIFNKTLNGPEINLLSVLLTKDLDDYWFIQPNIQEMYIDTGMSPAHFSATKKTLLQKKFLIHRSENRGDIVPAEPLVRLRDFVRQKKNIEFVLKFRVDENYTR